VDATSDETTQSVDAPVVAIAGTDASTPAGDSARRRRRRGSRGRGGASGESPASNTAD
jgi:hypothetical protein